MKSTSIYASQQWCESFWSCLLINVNALLNWILLRAKEELKEGSLISSVVISISNVAMGELKRHWGMLHVIAYQILSFAAPSLHTPQNSHFPRRRFAQKSFFVFQSVSVLHIAFIFMLIHLSSPLSAKPLRDRREDHLQKVVWTWWNLPDGLEARLCSVNDTIWS